MRDTCHFYFPFRPIFQLKDHLNFILETHHHQDREIERNEKVFSLIQLSVFVTTWVAARRVAGRENLRGRR